MEVLVVCALLALFAAVAVPRFAKTEQREFRLAVEKVADLMTMFAQREQTELRPIGLLYDPGRHWLMLVVLDGVPGREEAPMEWRVDQHVRPVKLPDWVSIRSVRADGEFVDISEWPLATQPGHPRPSVTIEMEGRTQSTMMTMASYAVSPRWTEEGRDHGVADLIPIDLDSVGRAHEPW